ncbi:hypothetical protein DCO58_07295 [Helicobacter saguini]|nr:hypothetical protein [Helicobacter saguini]MWV61862.1 hypothetical protein [Helicobacter saguini]MWV67463.1 hypothetical protein [Helicobacter saguini]TLD95652.1 hypothetical protein LS64_002015 [Helicobacter saguini]
MSGSSFNERAVVLKYLLKEKVINNVIYSLDWFGFSDENVIDSFDFLYIDDSIKNIRIYFNPHFITCALSWNLDFKCVGKKYDIYADSMNFWMNDYKKYFGSIKNYLQNPENIKELKKPKEKINIIESKKIGKKLVDKYVLNIMKNNPQTQFYLLIPTTSRLYYKLKGDVFLKSWQQNIRYVVSECENLQNVRIYGFDDLDYADNIANYKDSRHYNVNMNLMQLKAIANQTHILDSKNIESYLQTMQEKIKNYDISPLITEVNLLKQ